MGSMWFFKEADEFPTNLKNWLFLKMDWLKKIFTFVWLSAYDVLKIFLKIVTIVAMRTEIDILYVRLKQIV